MIGKKDKEKQKDAMQEAKAPVSPQTSGPTQSIKPTASAKAKAGGGGINLALVMSLLIGVGSAVSLYIYRKTSPSLFAKYFPMYEMLFVFGLVALTAMAWGFFKQKKAVAWILVVCLLAEVVCQVFHVMPVVAVYAFLVDVLGLLPMMITKVVGLLVGIANPPQLVSSLVSWGSGILFSLLFALVPKIIYA